MKDLFELKFEKDKNLIIIETNELGERLLKQLEEKKGKDLSEIFTTYLEKAIYVSNQRNNRKFYKK